ncbi:protein artichoke-like [Culicoides brevitarsis]|uniref:protein artichoke-like n=1 Tax=Culicoides brevitarsis TaxID=469753 RepID=UPI00307C57DD
MKHNYFAVIFLVFCYFLLFCVADDVVELQCRATKESKDVCLVTKKGNFHEKNVTIVSGKAAEVKHMKILRVDLGKIPSGLKNFRKLETVTFESCGISSLDGMKNVKSVQQIFLNKNEILKMGDAKFHAKVVYIEAQFNKMENVTRNAFKNLPNLYWLDLSNNRIKKLPKKVFQHNPVLTSLNLNNNRLRNVRQVFRHQENLRFLRLAMNRITIIQADDFKNLKNLRELDVSGNKITSIDPKAFDGCQSLVMLNLSKNFLMNFQFTIVSKSLSFLYLMENPLQNVTLDYKEKPSRLVLDASREKIQNETQLKVKFPRGLPLAHLNLANTNLNNVNNVARVKGLQKLSLANNTAITSSSLISLLTLTNLQELNLQGTNLTPEQLTTVLEMTNLVSLDVSGNPKLRGVTFKQRSNSVLSKLVFNNCNLTQLNVPGLRNFFTKLQEIHISGNNFTCEYLKELVAKLHNAGIRAHVSLNELNKCPWFARQ